MYATIMVPAQGDGTDETALNMAVVIGKAFGAHIDFVRVHRSVAAQTTAFASLLPAGNLGDAYVQMIQDTDAQLTVAARKALDAICKSHNIPLCVDPEGRGKVSFAYRECDDRQTDLVAEARFYDLIVTAGGEPGVAGDVVIGSGRPVVLSPAKRSLSVTRTVAIAWKETAEAARAVSAAMPLLSKAERVVVIAANETEGGGTATARSAHRLVEQLAWHGIKAEPYTILSRAPSPVDAVLNMADEVGADILVMGAYGHARLRELVFGGFTRHVLNNETLPVFLFH
jgi:nucleotide-binding universal stress UspA family protein